MRVRLIKRLKYKYPTGHKYFRSEKEFAKDLSLILAQPITLKTKINVINSVLWGWTERFGKYKGCRGSYAAHKHYNLHGYKGLRHDHAIPRNILVKMIVGKRTHLSANKMLKLLREFCVAVVITSKEDSQLSKAGLRQKMPKKWNLKDLYARYKSVGIKIAKNKRCGLC